MSRRVTISGYVKFHERQVGQPQQSPGCLPHLSNGVVDELNYFDVQLLKDDLCGVGSYGRVCKAMVDQLTCAAKIIHPTFFTEVDPSSTKTMLQFQKECEFLSVIRHPCIIQYLGITQDIETGLPVLLMELMEENLTQFLERIRSMREEVPYHTVVNLSHDVLMALAFLHSNGIVHRDLSSNNILMVAEAKAKVTDFGMARLIDANRSHREMLTQCPGALVYMPPEALRTPPTYSAKLDVFSLGVVIIQMITSSFPRPGAAKRTVEDLRHGTIEVPIPERERRKDDIANVREGHPLFGTVLDCLADFEGNRPSSKELCHRMIYYKSCPEYLNSVAQADERRKQRGNLEEAVARKDREIASLKTKLIARAWPLTGPVAGDVETELESITGAASQLQINDVPESHLSLEAPPTSQWYHGPISRATACQHLEAVGSPGAYLIRESSSEPGSLVLSFLDSSQRMHHFRIIKSIQGQYNIGGNIWFSSLAKLVGFHTKYSSVMENVSERLDIPVPPVDTALPEMSLQDRKYQYKQMTTFEDKELGRGAYGQVCQGLCDELPCAVKCLHRNVFQFMDGSAEENAKKIAAFEQACQILISVHHPCIVHYLDAYIQPETGLAVLLMELMDETLNCFLDRSPSPLPIHLQIDICFDVIQAITYLHSCNIIHRNLTGNNVLVSGGSRAKVTDFGMMRIVDSHKQFSSHPRHMPLPDSTPYMPPEVFRHPPSKTTQLDIFSFGVVSLQVMTGHFPQPSSINASEIERRKSDINSLEHPMLLATLSCLKDRDILRPTAVQLCRKFKQLRETPVYEESQAKREQALQAIDAMSKELDEVHKKNEELIAKLEYVRYENEHLIQLISSQTENMSSNVDIAMPYVDPENVDQASLLEYQMDFSAPHPALWYHGSITRDTACMRLQSIAKPGAYLVRMSESDPGSFVLSFLDKQLRLFNYKISCKNGKYNASGQGRKWFPSLQNLIGYYTRHSTVKQNQHLDIPVAPPKVVPLPNS